MGRVVTFTAEGMALDATKKGDLIMLAGATNKPFEVLMVRVTQRELETSSLARFRLLERSAATTQAVVSGTVGVNKHQLSDSAPGITATMNRVADTPTLGAVGRILDTTSESLPVGMVYRPTPREIFMLCGTWFCVELADPHAVAATTLTFDVVVTVEEYG